MVAGGPLPMREGAVHNIPLRKRKAQQRELGGLRAPPRCEGPRETMHNYFAYIII